MSITTIVREEIIYPFIGILFGNLEIGTNIARIAVGIIEITLWLLIARFLLIQAIRIYKKEMNKKE